MSAVAQVELIQFGNIMFSSALAFLYYDHLLTSGAEVRLMWCTKNRSLSKYMFLFNRYFAFFGNMFAAYSVFSSSLSISSCQSLVLYHQIFMGLTQATVACILTLRVYALYNHHRILLISFLGYILLGLAATISFLINNHSKSSNITYVNPGCRNLSPDMSSAATVAAGWEGILLIDIVLFALTMWKAHYTHLQLVNTSRIGVSLFAVVVRDGSIYFLIMASLNLVNIITFYIPGNVNGNLSAFVGCLAVTLMSHMILGFHCCYQSIANVEICISLESRN
ncbi:hypothetical protein J3R30DRAFT_3686564 [Lentinula aciculospora]|uniref:DUF6533 domain-containing protein n=1 Tax=Lentinula aciculospora TaxID=153920 RepID=A0A9W8ZZK6_9AGAR|nr:hypothetical protein J3R30DRAFT_3686564 [Lentinula aciculospora]